MSEMVSDIMDYSQFQSGYLHLNKGSYDLREIVENEAVHCEGIARENHLFIQLEQPDAMCRVQVDALKISQVLRNLLYNAINHTKDGEIITVRTRQETAGFGYQCSPRRADSGRRTGTDLGTVPAQPASGGTPAGDRIGLSIVKAIVDAHGMTCGVDCRDGMTDFWFFCPKYSS